VNKRFLRRSAVALALFAASPAFAQANRTELPIPPAPFGGRIAENVYDSTPATARPLRAPQGAPNVLLFMSDDVGFGMASSFGGPVPTPNFDRLASAGQRYNRFHTTGVCSPSRASVLTGRNHHAVGNGHVSDLAAGYPGYRGFISRETVTIAQTLRLNGYGTAMFGKHHNLPPGEDSPAGPFDNWPTGLGFEYFFGIVTADSDQFNPNLYRGTNRVDADEGSGDMLEKRLADDIIGWVHTQKAAAPGKPFFVYYSPGSTHAPHQVPVEYSNRFKGKFDQGWDKLREETFRRQLADGIIPPGTQLTPRPEKIPAWDTLNPGARAFAIRSMEVAAGMLAYQDEQVGRVIDELTRMGEIDNTLIALIVGDNGASMDAGLNGTLNETYSMTRGIEDPAWLASVSSWLGGPLSNGNYPAGWAWAMGTPLRWGKMYNSVLGATRNGMVLAWPGHVANPGSICARFGHVNDIVPTILEAAKLPAPTSVYGVKQKPMDGSSLLPSLSDCEPDKPRTQYFEVGGKLALYHNGWFASNDDGRMVWEDQPPTGPRPQTQWSLYNLDSDFSQGKDLSAKYPDRMQQMIALWRQEAERNQVFPLDHTFGLTRAYRRPFPAVSKHFDYWGKGVSVPANSTGGWGARSFTLDADLVTDNPDASGVVSISGQGPSGVRLCGFSKPCACGSYCRRPANPRR
jgi:arylsulfatase